MAEYPRISGRVGQTVNLNVCFYRNGQPADPYAIRLVRIYRREVKDANLVAELPFSDPGSSEYPLPAVRVPDCVGCYVLPFDVPKDFSVPDIYFDVWYFFPDNPGSDEDIDDPTLWQSQCMSQCNRFWLYPDGWCVNDGLSTPRLGFEPLDVKFRAGEQRNLEVGMMPLPLYDYDYNRITPMLPYLQATISIFSRNCEMIVNNAPMNIGLRQGSYRSNPFVLQYPLDTSKFLIGTYDYQVTVQMPCGSKIVSPKYTLTIS